MNGRSAAGPERGNPAGDAPELLLSIRRILSEVSAYPDGGIDIEIPDIPATGSRLYPRFRDDETGDGVTRRISWLATRTAAPQSDAGSFDTDKLRR